MSGDPSAQISLGYAYGHGWGVEKSRAKATKLYRQAAEAGELSAQYNLGVTLKDPREAMKWLRKAARQGHLQAQVILAEMYEGQEGIRRNIAAAIKWYRKAADGGDGDAREHLRELERSRRRKILSVARKQVSVTE